MTSIDSSSVVHFNSKLNNECVKRDRSAGRCDKKS